MDAGARLGQLLFVGIEGTEDSPSLRSALRELSPGGVVLFARNVVSAEQVRELNAAIVAACPHPPFVAIDQEGGRVSRLKGVLPPLPSPATVGAWPETRIASYAAALGEALAALGFNTNFAPVVDLSAPGAVNLIGDRAFGEDAERVTACARAFVAGLAAAGIASFLKHFPGLGATEVDSHVALPVCSRSAEEMWRRDLLPYRRVAADAAGVMIGHVVCPAWEPEASGVAATLSETIVTGLLRVRMGYEGIAVTDDLGMGAVGGIPPGELAMRALGAGNDMLLFCNDAEAARRASGMLRDGWRTGAIGEERLDRSLGRILARKRRFGIGSSGPRAGRARPDWQAALAGLQPYAVV
jgi:beta-N-acetylhexosaminidase